MESQAGGGPAHQSPSDGKMQGVSEAAAVRRGVSDIQYAERSDVRGQQVEWVKLIIL